MAKISSPSASPPPPSPKAVESNEPEPLVAETEPIKKALRDAEEIKQEGNDHFRSKEWVEALVCYRNALAKLPPREEEPDAPGAGKGKERQASPPLGDGVDTTTSDMGESDSKEATKTPLRPPMTQQEVECAKARSVINANIAACHVKLGEEKEAVEACNRSLLDDPLYVKALQRRATCNVKINSWSSLSSAQEDYNSLLELLPPGSAQQAEAKRELMLLKPRVESAQKAETAEMLDKLKGLGNSLLGNFGLSTDNFKFEPNGQGGYSMNFVK